MARRKNNGIRSIFSKIKAGVKAPFSKITSKTDSVSNIGQKVENKAKSTLTSAFKDIFTFSGSEKITQAVNTVENVKQVIDDPVGYTEKVVKYKVLNKILDFLTDGASAIVSTFSKSAGLVVKEVGDKINDAITTKVKNSTSKKTDEQNEQDEQQQEDQEEQSQQQQDQQQDQQQNQQQQSEQITDNVESWTDEEGDEMKNGAETNREYIDHTLKSLPTELVVVKKTGEYRTVSIASYKEELIDAFRYNIGQNGADTYESSDITEYVALYEEFNRQYSSVEGEQTITVNFEQLYNWLMW